MEPEAPSAEIDIDQFLGECFGHHVQTVDQLSPLMGQVSKLGATGDIRRARALVLILCRADPAVFALVCELAAACVELIDAFAAEALRDQLSASALEDEATPADDLGHAHRSRRPPRCVGPPGPDRPTASPLAANAPPAAYRVAVGCTLHTLTN